MCSMAPTVPAYTFQHALILASVSLPTNDQPTTMTTAPPMHLQAGLSWATILAKRPAYRTAFEGFDPAKVAAFDEAKLQQLMSEGSGVVRHRGKLQSAIQNARQAC